MNTVIEEADVLCPVCGCGINEHISYTGTTTGGCVHKDGESFTCMNCYETPLTIAKWNIQQAVDACKQVMGLKK